MINAKFPSDWFSIINPLEFKKEYFTNILTTLEREKVESRGFYPPEEFIFRAFDLCKLDKLKVIIIGQDPYHGAGQANGLAFSVNRGFSLPPSLANIFLEINDEFGTQHMFPHGDLSYWAEQGVLLLNSVLTVAPNSPESHSNIGWEKFTQYVIDRLSQERERLIFLLWGNYAKNIGETIDRDSHFVFSTSHPSPFSFGKGFKGCGHFKRTNDILEDDNLPPIDWFLK